ncbi:hypothetical protein Tco_0712482 [Tanacetum coccineum]
MQLEAPLLQVDIDKVVKNLGPHKAPGEDGFPGLLFQKYWHIVGDAVSKSIKQFFDNGIIPRTLNKTLVVLLPKSAYISGRLIQDYMVGAKEAFHYIHNKKKGDQRVMALKLDLNKAFDRFEWDILMATCRKIGF